MINSIVEWHVLEKEPAPDSIRIIFLTKGWDWCFGMWDSDHNHYTDDHAHDLYDILAWAYIPKVSINDRQ